ncbi:MAG: DUF2889 domain-containing protein [Blastocatellales bacterium]|nr:DUF2889 domain-containing protein [Blastocatellales bacterium]
MPEINLSFAVPPSGYERIFDAEIDCVAEDELLVRGRMRDHRFEFTHTWRLRTPIYEVINASAEQLSGDSARFDPGLCERYANIRGVRIGRGFSRRILDALGEGEGRNEHLLLAIEMARAGQQLYQFPPGFTEKFPPASDDPTERARTAWLKDRAYMTDLVNSCYTYRDETASLFDTRTVNCGFSDDLTRPRPGDRRAFWRRKRVAIEHNDRKFDCVSAMEDSVHDIEVRFVMGADGVISSAASRGLRLPYHGICEDAQNRTPELAGLRVTPEFIRQFADAVGGRSGCTHLFDLSIDCLRLFRFGGEER